MRLALLAAILHSCRVAKSLILHAIDGLSAQIFIRQAHVAVQSRETGSGTGETAADSQKCRRTTVICTSAKNKTETRKNAILYRTRPKAQVHNVHLLLRLILLLLSSERVAFDQSASRFDASTPLTPITDLVAALPLPNQSGPSTTTVGGPELRTSSLSPVAIKAIVVYLAEPPTI